MKTSNVIAGLLLGIIAGAALGVLYAPDKGTETRRRISRKGTDLADMLKDKIGGLVDAAVSKYEDMRGYADEEGEAARENTTV